VNCYPPAITSFKNHLSCQQNKSVGSLDASARFCTLRGWTRRGWNDKAPFRFRSTEQPISRSADQPISRSADQPSSRAAEQPSIHETIAISIGLVGYHLLVMLSAAFFSCNSFCPHPFCSCSITITSLARCAVPARSVRMNAFSRPTSDSLPPRDLLPGNDATIDSFRTACVGWTNRCHLLPHTPCA